jgi:hypothetical protein
MFVGAYRFFLLIELHLLRARSPNPSSTVIIILFCAFVFYITVEASASFDRAKQAFDSPFHRGDALESENVTIWAHTIYFPVSVIFFCFAWLGNGGVNHARLIFVGLSVLASSATTLVTRVRAVQKGWWVFSIVPAIMYASVHATLACAALFLMRSGARSDYKGLEGEIGEVEQTGLDIDQDPDAGAAPEGFDKNGQAELPQH